MKGHLAEQCRQELICSKCNLKGHLDVECRQHLHCSLCDRRGHLNIRCYLNKKPSLTAMALADDELPKWRAQINGFDVEVVLDSGAVRSFISKSLVSKLNIKTKNIGKSIETATGEIVTVKSTEPVEIIFESIPVTIKLNLTYIHLFKTSIQGKLGRD